MLAAHLLLLGVTIVWSGVPVVTKLLLQEAGVMSIVVLRLLLVGVLASVTLPMAGVRTARSVTPRRLVLLALLGGVFSTFAPAIALQWVPSTVVSLALAANPLATMIVSRVLLGEALTPRKVGALTLSTAGFGLIVGRPDTDAATPEMALVGIATVLAGQVCFGLYFVLSRRETAQVPPLTLMTYVSLISSLLVVPLVPFTLNAGMAHLSAVAWAGIVFIAASHHGGQLLWLQALRRIETSTASLYMFVLPLFTSVQASFLLREPITLTLVLGGCAIIAGVALGNSRPRPKSSTPPRGLVVH